MVFEIYKSNRSLIFQNTNYDYCIVKYDNLERKYETHERQIMSSILYQFLETIHDNNIDNIITINITPDYLCLKNNIKINYNISHFAYIDNMLNTFLDDDKVDIYIDKKLYARHDKTTIKKYLTDMQVKGVYYLCYVNLNIINFMEKNDQKYEHAKRTIKQSGKIFPILIRNGGKKYDIADGAHRCCAAIDLGYTHIPVLINSNIVDSRIKIDHNYKYII